MRHPRIQRVRKHPFCFAISKFLHLFQDLVRPIFALTASNLSLHFLLSRLQLLQFEDYQLYLFIQNLVDFINAGGKLLKLVLDFGLEKFYLLAIHL